jgi:hypothetical protein
LRNFNDIANTGLFVLVVNTEFGPTPYILAVFWMLDLKVNGNFDAFGTTVAHYDTGYSF